MADQESNAIFMKGEAKFGLTLAMAVPGNGNAAPRIAKRVVDWFGLLGQLKRHAEVSQRASHSRSSPGGSEVEERKQHHHPRAS